MNTITHIVKVGLTGILVWFSACRVQEPFDRDEGMGNVVSFSVGTGYENGPETRTHYSGEVYNLVKDGVSLRYERIDWVENDEIRVYSDKAVGMYTTSKTADYSVTSPTEDNNKSIAALVSKTVPLTWKPDDGSYTFYALYPMPGGTGVDTRVSFSNNVATLYLPKAQKANIEEAKAMKYAYMGSAVQVDYGQVVPLDFIPLMNAFSFFLYGDENLSMSLKKLTVEAVDASIALTGKYKVTLSAGESGPEYTVSEIESSSNQIVADFSGSVQELPKPSSQQPLELTLFAIPQAITSGLRITAVILEHGVEVIHTVELKNGEDWVPVSKGQRIRFFSNSSDQWEYILDHADGAVLETLEDNNSTVVRVVEYSEEKVNPILAFKSYAQQILQGVETQTAVPISGDIEYALTDEIGNLVLNDNGSIEWIKTLPSPMLSAAPTISNNSDPKSKNLNAKVTAYSPVVRQIIDETVEHAAALRANGSNGRGPDNPQDLSLYDISCLSPERARNDNQHITANCYIVDKAGWYMFPVVYGNAVDYTKSTNGLNTYSYTDGTGTANADNLWHTFQRYDGQLITSPYILDDLGFSVDDVNVAIAWEDVASETYAFLSDVSIETENVSNSFYDPVSGSFKKVPYIKFRIPDDGAYSGDEMMHDRSALTGIRQGNALIVLRRNSDNTILWSWHIWITDENLTPVEVDTSPLVPSIRASNKMMPINLGRCDTKITTKYEPRCVYIRIHQSEGSAEPIVFKIVQQKAQEYAGGPAGTYYQWGRKDPFLPSKGNANEAKDVFSPENYSIKAANNRLNYSTAKNNTSAANAIKNPFVFYYWHNEGNPRSGWMTKYPNNLWNMNSASAKNDYSDSKTVYDPCPPGYCIPHMNAFTGFLTSSSTKSSSFDEFNAEDRNGNATIDAGDYEYGWHFYTGHSDEAGKKKTIFLPQTGWILSYYVSNGTTHSNVGLLEYCQFGYFWTSATFNSNTSINCRISSGSVCTIDLDNGSRKGTGFAVFAIKEMSTYLNGTGADGMGVDGYNYEDNNYWL